MKEKIQPCTLLMMLLIGFCFSFSAQAFTYNWDQPSGTISALGNSYVDNMSNTWNINVQAARPVRINYTIDVENICDKVEIFAVNADNTTTTLVATLTGSTNGTISTTIPTGKAKVVFTSDGSICNASGYIGINLDFSTDYSTSTYTSGNSIINGNLGIGTLNPTSKLHISNKSSLSGIGGAYISVIQKQPNTTATGDGSLSVEYSLTAASATNELVNKGASIRTNNYLTGGGVVQYQRVLNLSSGSSIGSTTTNLEMIRIENGGSSGTTTNAYGLNIVSLPGTNKWGIYDQSGSKWYTNGKLGIGDVAPNATLSVVGNAAIGYASGQTAPLNGMIISGSVGIGVTTLSDNVKLDVNGIIHAKEVKIDLAGFLPDYVFEKNYALRSLNEVHSFIQDNGHLPEIPSAAEVKKDGINVADMQVKLLKKIEELTLYAIEQQERSNEQQKRIEALEKELKQVKNK